MDKQLLRLLAKRDEADVAVQKRSAEVVRMWILRAGRAHLEVDDEHRSMALTYDRAERMDDEALDVAVGNLNGRLIKYRNGGHDVILADLNVFLGLEYNDRWGPGGAYYPPR